MGLLDSVIGALGHPQGGGQGGQGDLLGAVIGMLGQGGGQAGGLGGLAGLVAKLQQSGLGDVASSWVSSGQNLPISPDQLGGVLGNDTVAGLAKQLGLDHGDLLGQLSHMLPQVVDKLTPNGQIPHGDVGGMLGQSGGFDNLAGMLGGLLKQR
jgi:uncharacterized protein YidB (DUF937 family)